MVLCIASAFPENLLPAGNNPLREKSSVDGDKLKSATPDGNGDLDTDETAWCDNY